MSKILLLPLLSQYELLEAIAENLSTLDLFHLAKTCMEIYAVVRGSQPVFERLKRLALCDGRGLKARQEFQRPYSLLPEDSTWGKGKKAHYDEEIEVRVWNRKCDATNALPCLRCGVHVCEECRYVPRVRDMPYHRSRRRPHFEPARQSHNIVCYCKPCDDHVERDLPSRLSEYCDCDQYTRWICLPCKFKEDQPNAYYYFTRTKLRWTWTDRNPEEEEGMWTTDHVSERAVSKTIGPSPFAEITFWCPCGTRAPRDGNIRCNWCWRRHNLDTWWKEFREESAFDIPFFDNDPCYPRMDWSHPTEEIVMHPDLGYTGPIAE